jgi:hypothetical protein
MQKFIRQLIEVEIRLGFLNIPVHGVDLMPSEKTQIKVDLDGETKLLTYNPEYRRVFGLTSWYKKNKLKPKDTIQFSLVGNKYKLIVNNETKNEVSSKQVLDLSNLSTQAKGDIVEDRIKEFLLLHGQGLLSVYKPVSDTEGIDLIVVRNGRFHPLFLQVKGRYTLHQGRSLILSVKVKTFTPHANYYVIGAYFDPNTLEVDSNLLFIPSKDLVKNAVKVSSKNGEWYRIVSSIGDKSSGKWTEYLIKKEDLATKLIEKFEEMDKYIK